MIKELLQTILLVCCALSFQLVFAENTNFTTSHFSGSGNCASCHDGMSDTSGKDVSIVKDWGNSMMANSTKDPFWQAKVATELARNPGLSSVINDKCSKCHAPVANYEVTKVQGNDITLFGADGVLKPGHALYDAGMNGVTCTVCHQVKDDANLGTLPGFSGNYKINDSKTIYGQYSNITAQPMINNSGYRPAYSAHISDSTMCATCHNLKTPFVDSTGTVLTSTDESKFPEQMPYTEWQNSVFDDMGSNPQSCQDCHMPKTTAKLSVRPGSLSAKTGFAKHELVGANTTMLTLLRDNAAQLGVISSNLDLSISRTRSMLQSAVSLELSDVSVIDGVLEAHVSVQNNSGHKTPTSYPSRRMWLNFKVTDNSNNVVFESGRVNADGSIAGADNDADQSVFEPHYNTITSADQVQIYETIMGDSDSHVTYTLLRGAQYLKDNRLTPQGFDKNAVPDDVAVFGQAVNDDNFNLGSDEVVYRVPVAVAGDLNIHVSLNYQAIAHGFLMDMYNDVQLDQVQSFKAMYDVLSLKYEQISSAQTTVVSGGVVPDAPILSLSATPITIEQGESASLNWNVSNATNCSASGDWSGSRALNGSETVSPSVTSTYTLSCEGDGGSDSQSITVNVNTLVVAAPVVSLSATPITIEKGQSTTLNWSAVNATSCNASGAWSGSRGLNGSETVSPSVTSTYTLSCEGDGGSDVVAQTVTVNAVSSPGQGPGGPGNGNGSGGAIHPLLLLVLGFVQVLLFRKNK